MKPESARWRHEIEELHRFFQDWFRGDLPDSDQAFARVLRVLAPDLLFVAPSGERRETTELLEGIRAGHGRRPNLSIRIERPELHRVMGKHLVATYEEWQDDDARSTGRLSTVIFGSAPDAPNGLAWLHVHETWLRRMPGGRPT